jgi:RNA polymerase sigma factor (sigma-70 family)
MASAHLGTFLRYLSRAVQRQAVSDLTDAQLLERFVGQRDEAAFELLVQRHGSIVLSVCRRVLHHEHDSEDAFQATFLALACKAQAISRRDAVASWLYKVAYRIALRARAAGRALPLTDEPPPALAAEPILDLLRRELGTALDEEVSRLPDHYRAAFVLCQLEGHTTAAAAQALGCPPGTVGTRLARARDLLRRRLARRGFDLAVPTLIPGFRATPPATLLNATVRAAHLGSADQAAAAGLISARAAALTKGAMHTMSATLWQLTAAVVLAWGLLGGAASWAHWAAAVEPPAPAAADADVEPGRLFRLRLHENQPFYQEFTITTRQTMTAVGRANTQDQEQTFYLRCTPTERRPDGGWVLTQRLEGLKMVADIGGHRTQFDSTRNGSENNALFDFYKALIGSELRVTLDSRFAVRKVEGGEKLLQKQKAAFGYPASGQSGFTAPGWEVVCGDLHRFFPPLTQEPVRPGDSWARKTNVDLGPLGTYQATHVYTYEGQEGKLERIAVETTLKARPRPAKDAGQPSAIKNAKLERASGTGTILFDAAAGRVVRLDLESSLDGPATIVSGREEVGVVLGQSQRIRVRTTDANPLKATTPSAETGAEIERLRHENARLKQKLKAVEDALRDARKPNN